MNRKDCIAHAMPRAAAIVASVRVHAPQIFAAALLPAPARTLLLATGTKSRPSLRTPTGIESLRPGLYRYNLSAHVGPFSNAERPVP
jgi:hypothetical protein